MIEYKAVLFDFDGILADTMQDNFLAWKRAFADFNVKINPDDYFPIEGMKVLNIAKTLSKKYNQDLDCEKIVELKKKYYLENNLFCFYPGIEELIEDLVVIGKRLAIVSASPRTRLEKTVPEEFLKRFETVISGDDYVNGKPNPEPYLNAMNKLGLTPEECVVVENAPLGIKSAKSAGIYCIALTTTLDKEYLKEADVVLKNHKELRKFLF